jgi:hypothetical protein
LVVTQPINGSLDPAYLQLLPGAIGGDARGPSFLGLGTDQNSTTLGGTPVGTVRLPDFGRVQARAITSTYDPSIGGFSGADLAFDVLPGGEFTTRKLDVGLDPPSTTGESPSVHTTAAIDGPFGQTEYRGDAAIEGSYQSFAAPSLFAPGSGTPAGLAVDGVTRADLRNALSSLGAPGISVTSPANAARRDFSSVFRVDRSPYSRSSAGAMLQFAASRQNGVGLSAGAAGSRAVQLTNTGAVFQLFASDFTKSRALHDTRLTAYENRATTAPRWVFPDVSVLVTGSGTSNAGRRVALGGSPATSTDVTSGLELRREHQQIVGGNKHHLKYGILASLTDSRLGDGLSAQQSYAYPSLTSLHANSPSFAVVSANQELWREQTVGASGWFGDTWSASRQLQVIIGGRVDADFAKIRGPDLAANFTGNHTWLHDATISPRIGFRWIKWPRGFHMTQGMLGSFPSVSPNLFRGGIGLFRSSWPVVSALSRLSQSSAVLSSRLECLNPVTGPDWSGADAGGEKTLPCDASTASLARYSGATVAPGYRSPRSIRASLGWSRPSAHIIMSADATVSLNLDQPGWIDQEFANDPQFSLANGRQVFAAASSIDTSSGVLLRPVDVPGRLSAVHALGSGARSLSRRLMVGFQSPVSDAHPFWSLTYVLSQTTARTQGFQGTTAGNPLDFTSAPTGTDARHQLVAMGGMFLPRAVALTVYVNVRSGLPYTPIVGSDVNGDGYVNDRAFVDPTSTLAGDGSAVACLRGYSGRMVASNACHGPWQGSSILRLDAQGGSVFLPNRAKISLIVSNPLARLGSRHWGGASSIDPVAYHVTGFSASTRSFQLQPNAHFGRPPFVQNPLVSLQMSVDLSKPMDEQLFNRSVEEASRHAHGADARIAAVQARYARSVPDLYLAIIAESDSLFLSRDQFDSLSSADVPYRQRMDSTWLKLARAIVLNADNRSAAELLQFSRVTTDSAWAITMRERPLIRRILSPSQMPYLPKYVTEVMKATARSSIRVYSSH